MTDHSFSLKPHTAPLVDSTGGPTPSSAKIPHASKPSDFPIDEEEDYTIKCICGFQDDDGSTVFCERCETWQHIICYYYSEGIVVDVTNIDHNCADCEPRPLDAKGATERQSNKRREEPDTRKVKKTTTKSHKKKVKPEPNSTLTNGWSHDFHERTSRSPKDQLPPAKRPKTSHRHSGSINSRLIPLNSNPQPAKRSASSSRTFHSPTEMPNSHASNGFSSEPYSIEFLHLYDDDPGDTPMQANLFNDITITGSLSSWSWNVESLRDAANGMSPQEVFHRCDHPLDSMTLPCLHKNEKQDVLFEADGQHPKWKFLTIDSLTPKGSIVGELRGKIGHMQDYVQDPMNRWDYLRHPVPFVFFHPKLPIYIDTRCEGSICRYLRRSCHPNLSMKTILENGSDYHFCFVAKDELEAGSELTIPWVLDEHIRNFVHHRRTDDTKQDDGEEDYVTDWVGKVLADFGGCACDAPSQCALARYDRRHGGSANSTRQLPNGKHSKGRNGYTSKPSPPSTGHATNSRAGSEAVKHHDDEDHDESRSTPGSMRSKPRSRDLTPTHKAPGDVGAVPGLELSDREKRKIAAMEKNFEQLEQDKQPIMKKKKRNSGGSIYNVPTSTNPKQSSHAATSTSQPNTPGLNSKSRPMEASASRRRSGSPGSRPAHIFTAPNIGPTKGSKRLSQPPIPHAKPLPPSHTYVNSAVQTDGDGRSDLLETQVPPQPWRKPYISLTKRLLLRCQKERERLETGKNADQHADQHTSTAVSNSIQTSSSGEGHEPPISDPVDVTASKIAGQSESKDIKTHQTQEPGSELSNVPVQKPRPPDPPAVISSSTPNPEIKPPPPPWSSQVPPNSSIQRRHINGHLSNDLRVQLPSTPQLLRESVSESSVVLTPTSGVVRSPFPQTSNSHPSTLPSGPSNLVHPSPVKKVSLEDYINRNRLSNSKAESQSIPEKNASASPVLQQAPPNASAGLEGEPKAITTEGSAIIDTPMKDVCDPPEDKGPKV